MTQFLSILNAVSHSAWLNFESFGLSTGVKFQQEIEMKNINVVNLNAHNIHRQVKGLPLNIF